VSCAWGLQSQSLNGTVERSVSYGWGILNGRCLVEAQGVTPAVAFLPLDRLFLFPIQSSIRHAIYSLGLHWGRPKLRVQSNLFLEAPAPSPPIQSWYLFQRKPTYDCKTRQTPTNLILYPSDIMVFPLWRDVMHRHATSGASYFGAEKASGIRDNDIAGAKSRWLSRPTF
jgi:hypothetical protein